MAQQVQLFFGGLYFGTEDPVTKRYTEYGGTTGKLDLKVPWTNIKVRQAMNKAINREELLKVLYKSRADYMYVAGYYPDLPGWDPACEKHFPEMYGYDLKEAKRLLIEAGYPNGFKAKAWLFPFAGARSLFPWWRRRPSSCAKSASSWSWKNPIWLPSSSPCCGSGGPIGTSEPAPFEKSGGAADRPVQRREGRRAHV